MTLSKHETQKQRQNKKETNKTNIKHLKLCRIGQVPLRLCRHIACTAEYTGFGDPNHHLCLNTHGPGIFMQSIPFLIFFSKSWNFMELLQTPTPPRAPNTIKVVSNSQSLGQKMSRIATRLVKTNTPTL